MFVVHLRTNELNEQIRLRERRGDELLISVEPQRPSPIPGNLHQFYQTYKPKTSQAQLGVKTRERHLATSSDNSSDLWSLMNYS